MPYEARGFWMSLLHLPIDIWNDGSTMDHVMSGLLVIGYLAVVGFVIFLIATIILAIRAKIHWYRHRQLCQHRCGNYTLAVSKGPYPECAAGEACCPDCTTRHEADHEDLYRCPVHDCVMDKVTDYGLIYDVCPHCKGHWLSLEELKALRQRSYDDGYSAGRSSGTATGIAIGTAMG